MSNLYSAAVTKNAVTTTEFIVANSFAETEKALIKEGFDVEYINLRAVYIIIAKTEKNPND